jgi:aspartate racemase
MIDTVADRIAEDGIRTVGLLASPTTIRTKLYEDALQERGVTTVIPNGRQQHQIDAVIRKVLAGDAGRLEKAQLERATATLAGLGAEAILLGCTELPLVYPAARTQLPVYDCLEIYAREIVERYYV